MCLGVRDESWGSLSSSGLSEVDKGEMLIMRSVLHALTQVQRVCYSRSLGGATSRSTSGTSLRGLPQYSESN